MTVFLKFIRIFIINLTVGYALQMCFFLLKEGKDGSRGKIIHLFYQYFLGDVLGQAVGKQSLRFVCSSIGEHFQD